MTDRKYIEVAQLNTSLGSLGVKSKNGEWYDFDDYESQYSEEDMQDWLNNNVSQGDGVHLTLTSDGRFTEVSIDKGGGNPGQSGQNRPPQQSNNRQRNNQRQSGSSNRPVLTNNDEGAAAWVQRDKNNNAYLSINLPLFEKSLNLFLPDEYQDAFNRFADEIGK